MAEDRSAGRVVEWKDRGFGFISQGGGSRDVFFHASDVEAGPVAVGAQVTFEVTTTDKGQRAVKVRVAGTPPVPYLPPLEADLLTPGELWEELAPRLRESVVEVARSHNWVE